MAGENLDPRIREACDLLEAAQRMERTENGDQHKGTLAWRMAQAANLRSRAAALRREVYGQ